MGTSPVSPGWWYASNGERKGPISAQELHRLLVSGTLGPDTLVWKQGMQDWQRVGQVPPLAHLLASLPPEMPPLPEAASAKSGSPAAPSVQRPQVRKKRRGRSTLIGLLVLGLGLIVLSIISGPESNAPYKPAKHVAATEDRVIISERLGCQSKEHVNRMTNAAVAKDKQAFAQLYAQGLASGDCIKLKVGTKVRSEGRSIGLICLTPFGSTEPCYWTHIEAIQ